MQLQSTQARIADAVTLEKSLKERSAKLKEHERRLFGEQAAQIFHRMKQELSNLENSLRSEIASNASLRKQISEMKSEKATVPSSPGAPDKVRSTEEDEGLLINIRL